MRIFRRWRNLDMLRMAAEVIFDQRDSITALQAEMAKTRLENARATRNLVQGFLYACENDVDVTEPLRAGLRDLSDEVARLEEHAPR